MSRAANFVFLGAPGSGKGTYAARVSATLGIPAISTGEILRQAVRDGSALGARVKGFMDAGALVPDTVMGEVLGERLARPDCQAGFILDGYPRTLPQAEELVRVLTARGAAVSHAVAIQATEELLMRRLGGRRTCPACGAVYNIHTLKPAREGVCDKCGTALITRPDDMPETIRNRLTVYHAQSEPLVARYKAAGLIRTVDGGAPLEDVVAAIVKLVRP